jgi:hypothetical protein
VHDSQTASPFARVSSASLELRSMKTLQEDHLPIDMEIASALIEATPDTWKAAQLVVENRSEGSHQTLRHEISSPEGKREAVAATDRIFAASYRLLDVFKKHGRKWKKVTYRVHEKADQSWAWQSEFEY